MGNELVNPDEWMAWGYWIRNTTGNLQRNYKTQIAKKLYKLHAFVGKHMCCVDFTKLRPALYLPGKAGLWNRFVNLMVREIEIANDRRNEDLARDWELSGLGKFQP